MFDAHNKQESSGRLEGTCGEADHAVQPDTAQPGESNESSEARQPRVVCIGFIVFRI